MKHRFVSLVALLILAVSLYGQGQLGQISGRVTDPSGAVMQGVTVTVTGPAILQPLVATTGDTGTYQFPNVPIGTYSVKFESNGYRTSIRSGVLIEIGFNAQINSQMELAAVNQSVEVTAASPVVDTQSTTVETHIDQQRLQELPSGRGQYNMVETSPSVSSPTKDVGGNTNGQQTAFMFRGSDPNQTRFFMDGVDLAPAASSNAYWMDYDSIQEMQISEAGADVTQQSSALNINMVSKSGSDQFHGSAHYAWEDESLEANNITPAQILATRPNGASIGNPLQHFTDWGAEVGGPIKKGKLWFWGDWTKQTITNGDDKVFDTTGNCPAVAASPTSFSFGTIRACTHSDPVEIRHFAYKLGYQPWHNNRLNFSNRYDVKNQALFGYTPLRPVASTYVLGSPWDPPTTVGPRFWNGGWPSLWRWDDTQIINDRWIAVFSFNHQVKQNEESLHTPSLANVPAEFEQSTSQYNQSYNYSYDFAPNNAVEAQSTYFLPGKFGGDHSFKFGYKFVRYENYNQQNWGAGVQEIFNSGAQPAFTVPLAVNFYQEGIVDAYLYQNAVYFMDGYTRKRLHLNLGVRWDQQWDTEKPENIPASQYEGQLTANGTPFNYLPAIAFPGSKSPVTWNTFAPRLGATYDLFGNGKTLIKASFDQYFAQRYAGQVADTFNTTATAATGQGVTQNFVQLPWAGPNTGGPVNMATITSTTIRTFGGNFNAANPGSTTSPNSVDPNLKDPKTNEFVVGVSREIMADFGVDVNYIWRKYTDFVWHQLNGITSANYSPVSFTPPASSCPAGANCPTVTYFAPNIATPSAYTLANQPGYFQRYQGLEVVLRKRFSHRWLMNASYIYQSDIQVYPNASSYIDPTNILQSSGAQYAPSTGGYSLPVGLNARWMFRANGRYVLPWYGIGLSAVADYRQGYVLLDAINIGSRPNGAGAVAVLISPPGTTREPNLFDMDMRIDKRFTWRDRFRIEPAFDLYNLFNANTVLAQSVNQNSSTANLIGAIQPPRVARFSVRLTF